MHLVVGHLFIFSTRDSHGGDQGAEIIISAKLLKRVEKLNYTQGIGWCKCHNNVHLKQILLQDFITDFITKTLIVLPVKA